jgi:chromosome segregation ATPase
VKLFWNVLAAFLVVVAAGFLLYQQLSSRWERQIEDVAQATRTQAKVLEKQGGEIGEHAQRLGAAEARIVELSRAAEADRAAVAKLQGDLSRASALSQADLAKLRVEVEELKTRNADQERRRRELEDLARDLKKTLQRDAELERRLLLIEKQLGIERPQP